MNSPAHGLALFLAGSSIGAFGGDAPWCLNVNAEPEKPNDAVTLYDTGGEGQDTDELDITRPTFQVRVRSESYPNAYDKQNAILALLVDGVPTLTGFHVIDVVMTSNIATIGRDDQNRHVLVANYQAILQKE